MKIVFFDGYCTLCNHLVDWLMKADKRRNLKFASLQGETARRLLPPPPRTFDLDTVIYLKDTAKFERSTAILKVLTDLGGVWKFASVFLILPEFFRDFIYKVVARNRYAIFGKREACRLPTAEEKEFLLP